MRDVLAEMERCGIDLCGENGEYHTLVVDGPVFHKQVAYQTGKILDFGGVFPLRYFLTSER